MHLLLMTELKSLSFELKHLSLELFGLQLSQILLLLELKYLQLMPKLLKTISVKKGCQAQLQQ